MVDNFVRGVRAVGLAAFAIALMPSEVNLWSTPCERAPTCTQPSQSQGSPEWLFYDTRIQAPVGASASLSVFVHVPRGHRRA
jgi:hypothetical protein